MKLATTSMIHLYHCATLLIILNQWTYLHLIDYWWKETSAEVLLITCVCVCVCVWFPSTVEASPDWNKTINVMPEIRPAIANIQNEQQKHYKMVWNIFKVNNKNTSTSLTSSWCCYSFNINLIFLCHVTVYRGPG